jgi:hypothetical protein
MLTTATTVPVVSDMQIVMNVVWAKDQIKNIYLFLKSATQHSTAE